MQSCFQSLWVFVFVPSWYYCALQQFSVHVVPYKWYMYDIVISIWKLGDFFLRNIYIPVCWSQRSVSFVIVHLCTEMQEWKKSQRLSCSAAEGGDSLQVRVLHYIDSLLQSFSVTGAAISAKLGMRFQEILCKPKTDWDCCTSVNLHKSRIASIEGKESSNYSWYSQSRSNSNGGYGNQETQIEYDSITSQQGQ